MANLVELENLKMVFHAKRELFRSVAVKAIDGVSLNIEKGQTVALVGESGSGKTTLGRLSLRLLQPTAGRILFDNRDITQPKEAELVWFRKRAQAIFQDPYSSIDPFMSIYQILEEPLVIHGMTNSDDRRALVHKVLEDVRLTPAENFVSKYPHELSGGQRQRVGIARAVILKPEYIVADEPVSMIDASSRSEILQVLKDLQQKFKIAFLYITHDIATAKYFSDKIAVMYLGRIVELGPPDDVIEEPLHPYTQALIAAVPEPDPANRLKERPVVPGEPPDPSNVPPYCRFHPRCPSFMKGKCDVVDSALREVRTAHFVACHLYG